MENGCSIERPPQVAAGWSGAPGRLALSQAWITFLGGTGQQQEQALAQLVSGTDRLIELEQDVRGSDWVAQQRAALHAMLMRLVRSLPVTAPCGAQRSGTAGCHTKPWWRICRNTAPVR